MSVYYVDSVSGNDGNAGTSFDAPFKTLSAVVSVAATSDNIFLKAGSEWREALDVGALNNLTISYYGDIETNGLPVIRGDSILPATWDDSTARADANTNVYSQDITVSGGGSNYIAAWENDTRLTWAANVSACQSTAGSFTLSGGSGSLDAGTYTLYIHPNGSTNPNIDGKTYEASLRTYCINVGSNATIKGVHGRRAAYNNGAFNAGRNAYFVCLLADGCVTHQALAASGEMYRCIGWSEASDSRAGEIILEFFTSVATGLSGTWRECMAIHNDSLVTGFGGHSNGSTQYDGFSIIDCTCKLSMMGGSLDVNNATYTRPYLYNGSIVPNNAVSSTIIDPWAIITGSGLAGGTSASVINGQNATAPITIDGLRYYGDAAWNSTVDYLFAFNGVATTVDISNSVIVDTGYDANNRIIFYLPATQDVSVNGVVFNNGTAGNESRAIFRAGTPTGSYTGDNNVFWPDGVDQCWIKVGATSYTTPGAYLAAVQPVSEANSVEANPSVTDPANGNFHLNGSGLPATAGITRHNVHKSYMKDIPATLASAETWVVNRLLGLSDDALIDGVTRSVTRTLTRGVTEGWSWGA